MESKLSLEIDKLTTEVGDEEFRARQIKRIFCLTPGMQIWNDLEDLNIISSMQKGHPSREKQPFPGAIHPKCPCDVCAEYKVSKDGGKK